MVHINLKEIVIIKISGVNNSMNKVREYQIIVAGK